MHVRGLNLSSKFVEKKYEENYIKLFKNDFKIQKFKANIFAIESIHMIVCLVNMVRELLKKNESMELFHRGG